MSIIVGIDVGGSTTKIVGFNGKTLLSPMYVRATDPIASIYGAFGKFASQNKIPLSQIGRIMITGVGSTYIDNNIYGITTEHVDEFAATGRGDCICRDLMRPLWFPWEQAPPWFMPEIKRPSIWGAPA